MTYPDMIRRVTREWTDHAVCVFRMGDQFGVATPGTPDCVELELTKGADLLGCYRQTYLNQRVAPQIARDL